jgi:hypothetical protein
MGIDKPTIKGRLKALQVRRRQALADRDHKALADVRMRAKRYKRMLKGHVTPTA